MSLLFSIITKNKLHASQGIIRLRVKGKYFIPETCNCSVLVFTPKDTAVHCYSIYSKFLFPITSQNNVPNPTGQLISKCRGMVYSEAMHVITVITYPN